MLDVRVLTPGPRQKPLAGVRGIADHESQVGKLRFATRPPGIGAEHLACKLLVRGSIRGADLTDRPQVILKSRVALRFFTGSIHAAMWLPFGGHASQASEKGPAEVHGAGCPPT